MTAIPTSLKVGKHKVGVHLIHRKHRRINGRYFPAIKTVEIYAGRPGSPRDPASIRTTFWHELTHAILFEMEHPQATDETFVTQFSTLLSHAIDSAKFEQP